MATQPDLSTMTREQRVLYARQALGAAQPPSPTGTPDVGSMTREQRVEYARQQLGVGSPAAPVATAPQEKQLNILQSIAKPFTDIAATGIRTAQGLSGLAGAGIAYLSGDKEGAKRQIMQAGEKVEQPVNIPLLGKGEIRKIGTVTDKGSIVPSGETVKSLGTALEAGSFFAPVSPIAKGTKLLPRLVVRGAEGALAGTAYEAGRAMSETGDLSQVPKRALSGAVTGGVLGAGLGAAGRVANVVGERVNAPALAARAVNSFVKPLSKQFQFGKNPGAAIARYRIIGNSMEELAQNVTKARQGVGKEIGKALDAFVGGGTIDARASLQALDDAVNEAMQSGDQALFKRLNELKTRLGNTFSLDKDGNLVTAGKRNLADLTPKQANEVKQMIGDMVKWTEQKTEDDVANGALYEAYRDLKQRIELEVPALKKLNDDWGNLLEAEKAITYRDAIRKRHNLISLPGTVLGVGSALISMIASGGATIPALLMGAAGVSFDKALQSPAVMSRVAAWLMRSSAPERTSIFQRVPLFRKAVEQVPALRHILDTVTGGKVTGAAVKEAEAAISTPVASTALKAANAPSAAKEDAYSALIKRAEGYTGWKGKVEKVGVQPLDAIGKMKNGPKTINVGSDLFVAGNTALDASQKGKIIYDKGADTSYWAKKIAEGERPPVLVGTKAGGGLQVLDGSKRMNAYQEAGITDVPVILTDKARTQLSLERNIKALKSGGENPQKIISALGKPSRLDPACIKKFRSVAKEYPSAKPVRGVFAETLEDAKRLHADNLRRGTSQQLGGFTHIKADVRGKLIDNNPPIPKGAQFFTEQEILSA